MAGGGSTGFYPVVPLDRMLGGRKQGRNASRRFRVAEAAAELSKSIDGFHIRVVGYRRWDGEIR